MPICRPEHPRFASSAERQVWKLLRDQVGKDDVLLANVRVTDREKDHEADVVVLMPGAGVVIVEVKGGSVWRERGKWRTIRDGSPVTIHPVEQARGTHYALRTYVEADLRWQRDGRPRTRWAHAVALPNTELPADFACLDCPRWMVADRKDLRELSGFLRDIPRRQKNGERPLDGDDAQVILEVLAGRGQAQRDVVADAEEREFDALRLTEEQAMILGAIRLLHRVEIRGGAGSGKTWLAIEQARRLSRSGKRVALLCYSRGLGRLSQPGHPDLAEERPPGIRGRVPQPGTPLGCRLGQRRRQRLLGAPAARADARAGVEPFRPRRDSTP